MRLFEQLKNVGSPTWRVSWGSGGQGWARTGGDFGRAKCGSRVTGGVGIVGGRIRWGSCIKNANASAGRELWSHLVCDPFGTDGEAAEAQLGVGTSAAWIRVSPPSSASPSSPPAGDCRRPPAPGSRAMAPVQTPGPHLSGQGALGSENWLPEEETSDPHFCSEQLRRWRNWPLACGPTELEGGCQAEAPLGGGRATVSLAPKLSLPLPFPKLPGTSEAFTLLPTHFPALGYTLSRM